MGCGLLAPDLRVRFRFTGAAPFLRSFMRFCFACLGALRFAWFLSTTTAPVVVVIGATWGFALRGRSSLDGGEQMHRQQGPLASFAPSGNTDKLAKLYV